MKHEDYLWDKTGENPEIEKLENQLQTFRYQETSAPRLSVKAAPMAEKRPRWSFRFALAFATCAAVLVATFGIWIQFQSGDIETAADLPKTKISPTVETKSPRLNSEFADDSSEPEKNAAVVRTNKNPEKSADKKLIKTTRKVKKIKTTVSAKIKENDSIPKNTELNAKNTNGEISTEKITYEEKFAYDQLMLALAITSSKLKYVKDKVAGVEVERTVPEKNQSTDKENGDNL